MPFLSRVPKFKIISLSFLTLMATDHCDHLLLEYELTKPFYKVYGRICQNRNMQL